VSSKEDTIAAIATPPGRGGIGIVRISGPRVQAVASALLSRLPSPRIALFTAFLGSDREPLDDGIALFFPAPHSFTGEDVLELQGHGGPVVMDVLLQRVLSLGIRLARPGEFTERAFLNGKLDLAQAEAVADLITSTTQQAARSALCSLQGAFSKRV
jgi:tRNA modification GTPase